MHEESLQKNEEEDYEKESYKMKRPWNETDMICALLPEEWKDKFKTFVKNQRKDLFPAFEQEKKPFDVVLEVLLKSNSQRQEFLQGFVAKMQSLSDWNVSVNQFNEATIRISDLMALGEPSDSDEKEIDTNWTLKMEALIDEELKKKSVEKT